MELEKQKESENCIWMSFRSHCREGCIALSFEERAHVFIDCEYLFDWFFDDMYYECNLRIRLCACVFELSLTV